MKKFISVLVLLVSIIFVGIGMQQNTASSTPILPEDLQTTAGNSYEGNGKLVDDAPVYSLDNGEMTLTGRVLKKGDMYKLLQLSENNKFYRVSANEWIPSDYHYVEVQPDYNLDMKSVTIANGRDGIIDVTNTSEYATALFEISDKKMIYTGEHLGQGKWAYFDKIYGVRVGDNLNESARFLQVSTNRWIRITPELRFPLMNSSVPTNPVDDPHGKMVLTTKGLTTLYERVSGTNDFRKKTDRRLAPDTAWFSKLFEGGEFGSGDDAVVSGYYQVSTDEFVDYKDVTVRFLPDDF
ncbi:hypothetical protein [Companilactobacillus ginsenosidimutans]|uniref:Surface layer protein A domain-containing protein n=1 Tax=Companilactobacillus ginsenosidimutans TaxID=1007676 RepID=A0A0H4R0D9_9LACO|nr:hypothetical protein [Companilactobacillus ginsenosidimutans]AKP67185.1 hypothetical protein ABM34_06300 [Companilactobacillus ginsenosidimutans]